MCKTFSGACNKRQKHQKGQKHRRNPIILAREWKEALDRGEYASHADLARQKGVSRARVTQILNLVKLDPEVQEIIIGLGDPVASGCVTERKLRKIVGLSRKGQEQPMKNLLSKR